MNVAFCITCKNRTGHLERTLPVNLEQNRNAITVLVNYSSQDHLENFVRRNHMCDIDSGKLAYFRFTEPTPFRMAHAKNLAHRLAMREGADVLVNLDADNYAGRNFDGYAAECFGSSDRIFLWANMVKGKLDRGISGRIAVSRDAFVAVGGYDEQYSTYSPDDKDFNYRLRSNEWNGVEIDSSYLTAIRHNDKMRFREYPQARTAATYDFNFDSSERLTVVNSGDIGTGVVYKNFQNLPVEIHSIPTRVFGIGMHKTGTTSLHHALKILGANSAHWKSAKWARMIWDEMAQHGRSATLEKSYALCDLPIPLLYKELDRAYPKSKFILTLRKEEDWLRSVAKHFGPENPFRSTWGSDHFTHKVHFELYGRKSFDEQTFIARYRRHNAEVLEYFKSRKQDLLIMDMSLGAGWHELCGFLRAPLPDHDYPRTNISE